MKPAIGNFMIHVDEALSEAEMESLADSVCTTRCVTSACVSASDPHLMIVNYDSDCTTARDIVDQVRARGVHAEAVGL